MDRSSGCEVCIGTYDYETADDYSAELLTVEAGNCPASCCECGQTLQTGTQYECASGTWDERYTVYLTCITCYHIRNGLSCDGYVHAQLWDGINQYVFPDMSIGCVRQIETVEARKALLKRWWEWKEWQ